MKTPGNQWELAVLAMKGELGPVKDMLAAHSWTAQGFNDIYAHVADATYVKLFLDALDTDQRKRAVEDAAVMLRFWAEQTPPMKAGTHELLDELKGELRPPVIAVWTVPQDILDRVCMLRDYTWLDEAQSTALCATLDPLAVFEGVPMIHMAALAGNLVALRIWQASRDHGVDGVVYPRNMGFTFGPDPDGGWISRSFALQDGDTPLDAVDAAIAFATAARAAGPDDPSNREIAAALARFEASRAALVAAGATRRRNAPKLTALQKRLAALAASVAAPTHVVDELAVPVGGATTLEVLLGVLRVAGDHLARASAAQTEPFWQVALAARPSSEGLLGGEFDAVHLYDGTTETAFDWSSRARAIDTATFPNKLRTALARSTALAATHDRLWIVDSKQKVSLLRDESTELVAVGTLDKLLARVVQP